MIIHHFTMIHKPLRVVITENHSLDTIKSIINSKQPSVLILESNSPSQNNRVIKYTFQLITYYGWKWLKENSKIISKHIYDQKKRKKVTLTMIAFTLKPPDNLYNLLNNSRDNNSTNNSNNNTTNYSTNTKSK